MMAVGCRGQEALQRALLGSVSTGLVHHAHCPVAMIHDEAPILLQPSQLPVLVGIDGSPASELATAIAFEEASFRGVELVALHAWIDQDMTTVPGMDPSALKSAAETTLAERLAGFQARYPDVAVRRAVVFEHPARHAAAREEETRILTRRALAGLRVADVMTAHPHTAPAGITVEDFIQQYLLGDATRRIRLRTVTGRWLG
jgi:nucleotide-binding universal stress UspA family protein